MSSPATPAAAAAETVEKAPRKFPPPCWTQEETLCLIEAYRERWYALRRGYLRTADWDAVATTVSSRFPGVSPAKTSAQCRHKMEKLRQRYRAEKQRALAYPYPAGRYFSSWFFFDNMEAMESGTNPGTSVGNTSSDGSKLNSFLDDNMKLKLKAKAEISNSPEFGFDNGIKAYRSRISSDYSSMEDVGEEVEEDDPLINIRSRGKPMNGIPTPPIKSKAKNSSRTVLNSFDNSGMFDHGRVSNSSEQFWVNSSNRASKPKQWANLSSGGALNGSKRGRGDELEEIAASIKVLSEGYVKMERAKMEMAREMEETRMEMELKRNEMLLESQKQIVDAFVKGLFQMRASNQKKIKAKAGVDDERDSAET